LTPKNFTISTGPVVLAGVPLRTAQDLVLLRSRVRAAAEQFGLDQRRVRSFSGAAYEAAALLFGEDAGSAEVALTESAELKVVIRIPAPHEGAERQPFAELLAPVRDIVDRFEIAAADGWFTVTIATLLPLDAPGVVAAPLPPDTATAARPSATDADLLEENVRLRRNLIELQTELSETNRGVVALYAEADRQAERLRQAEDRLRVLVDSVHDYAICILDARGDIASWNAGAERVFGYSADEIIGRHFRCFYPTGDIEANLPADHLRAAIDNGRCECDSIRVRNGGAPFHAFVLLTPLTGADGRLRGFSLVVRDITERRHLENNLRRHAEDLAAATRTKEDFLATLSHELRTPLNAMLGWTRLVRMGKLNPSAMAHALETIERNAHVQEQLISDILDVSRIVTGKLRVDLRPLDLAPILDAAIDALRPAAAAKGVQCSTTIAGVGRVLGDPDRLQQVVWNLLANAIKFTPSGGRVSVSLARVGAAAVITVTDTGEGIAASLLPFVFDRFTQGDTSVTRPHGGLGLGLSIVRHIVELHGGHVTVHSDGPGRGAAFSVGLPVHVDTARVQ
jgi:PAS domain S-box-containing protein